MTAAMLAGGCEFSPCRRWRYTLWRTWQAEHDLFSAPLFGEDRSQQYLMVIGLNPSTADERVDDPTIRRCISFAKKYGFGALCMTNLFGWRETDPAAMMRAGLSGQDVVGPDNDRWLKESARGAGLIIAAWGNHGTYQGRSGAVRAMLGRELKLPLHAFRLNGSGEPEHPLYLPGNLEPVAFPV